MPQTPSATQTLLNSLATTKGRASVSWVDNGKNSVSAQISLTLVNASPGSTLAAIYDLDQAIKYVAETICIFDGKRVYNHLKETHNDWFGPKSSNPTTETLSCHGEPQSIEVWRHEGFECIAFRPPHGAWCGYVSVEVGHPWHSVDLEAKPEAVAVHGGVTWSRPRWGRGWLIGWDTSHWGDYRADISPYGKIWTLKDVVEETNALARQARGATEYP
jgi:hypothetical protein